MQSITLNRTYASILNTEFSQSSCFLLVFFGCRERLLALHSGQIGAFLWICWWQDRHAFMGGGCCWRKCLSPGGPRLLTSCCAAAAAAANWEATGGGGGSCGSGFQPGGARSRNLANTCNRSISVCNEGRHHKHDRMTLTLITRSLQLYGEFSEHCGPIRHLSALCTE